MNVDEVIGLFGGVRPLARSLGLSSSTVMGWKRRERIPAPQISVLLREAKTREIRLTPADFFEDAA